MSPLRKVLLVVTLVLFLGVTVLAAMDVGDSPTTEPRRNVPFRHGTGRVTPPDEVVTEVSPRAWQDSGGRASPA